MCNNLNKIVLCSLSIVLLSCGGGSSSSSNNNSANPQPANNSKPMPNNGSINYESNPLTVAIGCPTSLALTLAGGTPNMTVNINTTVSGSGAPTVSVTPNPLIADTTNDVGAITIDPTAATIGSYTLNLSDSYLVNGQAQSQNLAPIPINVVASGTAMPGNLAISPNTSSIAQGAQEQITLSLNGSCEVTNVNASISSDNSGLSISPSSCQLSSTNPNCKVLINAAANASGTANLSVVANGYTTKTTSISITPPVSGTIYYHIDFNAPATTNAYHFDNSQVDLLMSQFIAGAMYGHLIHEYNPNLQLDRDYLYGSLVGQWLQEDQQPDYLNSSQIWIDSTAAQRTELLNAGQGGPFQINYYAQAMSSGFGLVNFIALQQGLPYTVADQNSLAQSRKTGPVSLEYKYFGPMAAAYFHYNDLLSIESLASTSYWTQNTNTNACIQNVAAGKFPYLDMVLNAVYNAGAYSAAFDGYLALCANATSPQYSAKIAQIDNYALNNAQYTQATGINTNGTYILYPRQIRNYLDQLYNNNTQVVPVSNNHLIFAMSELSTVFTTVFSNQGVNFDGNPPAALGYTTNGTSWNAITATQANNAFTQALASNNATLNNNYDMSKASDRSKVFDILDAALNNLATITNAPFSSIANTNLTMAETGGGIPSCPTPAPAAFQANPTPAYTGSSIVTGSDGKLYKCVSNSVASWCNSGGVYAPTSGWAWQNAWSLYICNK